MTSQLETEKDVCAGSEMLLFNVTHRQRRMLSVCFVLQLQKPEAKHHVGPFICGNGREVLSFFPSVLSIVVIYMYILNDKKNNLASIICSLSYKCHDVVV